MSSMRTIAEKGNIIRTKYPGDEWISDDRYVNLYMGSGRFGGSFDPLGVMSRTYSHWACVQDHNGSNTMFMHAEHWSRGNFGLHYHLPVARIIWDNIKNINDKPYYQNMNIYDGKLTTVFSTGNALINLKSYFNPNNRDVFAMEIEHECASDTDMPSLCIRPQTRVVTQYENEFKGKIDTQEINDNNSTWKCRLKIGTADTVIFARIISQNGHVVLSEDDEGLSIHFNEKYGKHLLLMGVSGFSGSHQMEKSVEEINDISKYSQQCTEAWHRRWGESWVEIPDENLQAMWSRSVYYMLCSFSPDSDCISPAMGWSGNSWNFHFPQDFSYIVPALLRLGHVDIAKAKVEFYHKCLNSTVRNTKRIYGYDGAMWAWEHPIGHDFDILEQGSPNQFQFEIHNAAYPCRIAYETAMHLNDNEWTKTVAWPIIEESARFYASSLKRDEQGKWNLKIEPSCGQDEAGGFNATNYLCALYSAKYCLKTALEVVGKFDLKSEEYDRWRAILNEGLAFRKLYDPERQIYLTCEEVLGTTGELKQKHPVQLNPLIFLPLEELEQPVKKAYQIRYQLCAGVRDNISYGWTLGAFWLAASHMRDGEALLKELKNIKPFCFADEEFIQFLESSYSFMNQYYITTHGLYLQAINDALVSDYWGAAEIGAACPAEWEEISFNNLFTKDGKVVSGKKCRDEYQVHFRDMLKG